MDFNTQKSMMNKETCLIQGKELDRYFYFNDSLIEFNKLFNTEYRDERAITILGGTFIETCLEYILKEFLPDESKDVNDLFKFPQCLSNFSSKINLSFCLGLINKTIKDDLKLIKNIRNRFAHDLYVSFDDSQIKSWTKELKFHKISMMMEPPENASELEIFQVGVNQLISHLSGCIGVARVEKRSLKDEFKMFL